MIISNYRPEKIYSEEAKIYVSEEMKNIGQHTYVKTGMRRKGLAIANDEKHLYIINKDNVIIFKVEKTGTIYFGYNYTYSINRSINGFYIITWDGYRKITRVGKDDDFYQETTYEVFDENGIKMKNWDKEEVGIGKYPFELGMNMIMWNNVCYHIETLQPIFTIPTKFAVESIIQNNLIYLSVPGDYCEFVVLVRDGEIIAQHNIDKLEEVRKRLSLEERIYGESILKKINVKGISMQEDVKEGDELLKRNASISYSNGHIYPAPDSIKEYILKDNYSEKEFLELKQLSEDVVIKLKKIHVALNVSNEPRTSNCGAERNVLYLTKNIICLFYENAYILEMEIKGRNLYRFFSIDGYALSKESFAPPLYTTCYLHNDKDFKKCIFVMRDSENKSVLIIRVYDDRITTKEVPWYIKIRIYENDLELNNSQNGNLKYYDFDFNELSISYIKCNIQEKIKSYLYLLNEPFIDRSDYNCGTCMGRLKNGMLILKSLPPQKVLRDGILLLPTPRSYGECLMEINARHDNRPNYITDVVEIDNYILKDGVTSLFKFECRPWAFCDIKGKIYYDFDANKINLMENDLIS